MFLRGVFRSAIQRHLVSHLDGFSGEEDHFVRSLGDVVQVIELQYSIYGRKVTANLGLDLPWLEPAARWIERGTLGPHAHDCLRWVRIGRILDEPEDRWWSFQDRAHAEDAAAQLARLILQQGLEWLDEQSQRRSFLSYAQRQAERSKSPRRPKGRFLELRTLAAVLAWNHQLEAARRVMEDAQASWPEARGKLEAARAHYGSAHPSSTGSLAEVPDLPQELRALISELELAGTVAALPAIE